jgi:hypothetical protein
MADELETMKDWIAKKQTNSSRITPAKKDKVFETKVKVSADPQNPTVAKIIEILSEAGSIPVANAMAPGVIAGSTSYQLKLDPPEPDAVNNGFGRPKQASYGKFAKVGTNGKGVTVTVT